jgi:NAD-dependent DNA ligase
VNPSCKRIITGRIINFLDKLDVKDISDRSIEILYEQNIISDIISFLKIPDNYSIEEISNLETYGKTSAINLFNLINDLRKKEIPKSKLIGALGIPLIAEKKIKKLDKEMNIIDKLLDGSISKIDSNGKKTIEVIKDYASNDKNIEEINILFNLLNIVSDASCKGTIVFTGFRNQNWKDYLENKGYEVSENLTKDTNILVSANNSSSKYKKAIKYNIPVYSLSEFEEYMKSL